MRLLTLASILSTSLLSTLVVSAQTHTTVPVYRVRHGDHENDAVSSSMVTSSVEAQSKHMESLHNITQPKHSHMHDHGAHAAPLEVLDDSDIHNRWHHFPPTYLDADFRLDNDSAIFGEEFDEEWDPANAGGHKWLMMAHVGAMMGAYFGMLPISLALRAASSPFHYPVNVAFLGVAACGWLAGVTYSAATPDRYEGSKHESWGNMLLLMSIALAALDSLGLIRRVIAVYRDGDHSRASFKSYVISDRQRWLGETNKCEMAALFEQQRKMFTIGEEGEDVIASETIHPTLKGEGDEGMPVSRLSSGSSETLFNASPDMPERNMHSEMERDFPTGGTDRPVWSQSPRRRALQRFGELTLVWLRRTQVIVAYAVTVMGLSTYAGLCRDNIVHACLTHVIKGSIFFGYGILSYARYLGAYADIGWAWNRRPDHTRGHSAEMLECWLMFIYGITNTWMERIGVPAGNPYTVRQVQHISIAVMFWFAGLTGILLESRRVRRLLGSVFGRHRETVEPPSYAFSFNPLPALVIAVTGIGMSLHHQKYVFEVKIHVLWGVLLAGGSAFRFVTYFFLWLRPPVESTLPSRPPSELLASFGMTAGGIVFMLSSPEISWAAMRSGYDDMMAFLNVTVALTSFIFCWVLVVLLVKGLAVERLQKADRRICQGQDEETRHREVQ